MSSAQCYRMSQTKQHHDGSTPCCGLQGRGDRTVLNILQVVVAPMVIGVVTLSQVSLP